MLPEIKFVGDKLSEEETRAYVDYLEEKYGRKLQELTIESDGEYVNLNYQFTEVPFERIRRITGYLVGTMERWNDAKTAEEADRVKHSVSPRDIEEFCCN